MTVPTSLDDRIPWVRSAVHGWEPVLSVAILRHAERVAVAAERLLYPPLACPPEPERVPPGPLLATEAILAWIAEHPGCHAVAIGRALGANSPSITMRLLVLTRAGRVRRERARTTAPYRYFVVEETRHD